jgi:hypothetical protein
VVVCVLLPRRRCVGSSVCSQGCVEADQGARGGHARVRALPHPRVCERSGLCWEHRGGRCCQQRHGTPPPASSTTDVRGHRDEDSGACVSVRPAVGGAGCAWWWRWWWWVVVVVGGGGGTVAVCVCVIALR